MKIYLASSFLNKIKAREAMTELEKAGHVITYDWTTHKDTTDLGVLEQEAVEDLQGVRDADCFILLWPGRFGSSAELGIALALQKIIIIVGDVDRHASVYFNHPDVAFIPSITEAIDALEVFKDDR